MSGLAAHWLVGIDDVALISVATHKLSRLLSKVPHGPPVHPRRMRIGHAKW